MDNEERWLISWKEIREYLGRSAKTAQRWAKDGIPFYRDPVGRPIAKPSMIDEYIVDVNRDNYNAKKWRDDGIGTSISYEDYRQRKKRSLTSGFLRRSGPCGAGSDQE
jgi:hypothetical protein